MLYIGNVMKGTSWANMKNEGTMRFGMKENA